MISVILIDDNLIKKDKIKNTVIDTIGMQNVNILEAGDAVSAAELLEIQVFDLMILDLNLPNRKGENPKKDGGFKFLKQLLRGGPRFNRPTHILGLSAFDKLINDFNGEFKEEFIQLIKYDETSIEWSNSLQKKLLHISENLKSVKQKKYKYDLAILTALKKIELEAVLNLNGGWKEEKFLGDDTVYYRGNFSKNGNSISVIAAAAIEMGMPAAACLTMKVINNFTPKFIAMAGITAGIGLNPGDIIVADQSWNYNSGKMRTGSNKEIIFEPAPNYIPLDSEIKEKIDSFSINKKDIISKIQDKWQGNPITAKLSVKPGPVASGAAVIENKQIIDAIKKYDRKVIGVEMETYAVYLAARTAVEPKPKVFSAKSVCDFGIPPKKDEYQRYAAYTSANFIYEFALEQLFL